MTRQREEIWQEKLRLAEQASSFLVKRVPTIKGIALTGSVAYGDVKEDDDLDFLVITEAKRVFTTRFVCYSWAMLLRKKRKKNQENNSWCLNMFLGENALLVPKEKRSPFAARQIERMKVLYEQDEVFSEFVKLNAFWMSAEQDAEIELSKRPESKDERREKHNKIGDWVEDWLFRGQIKYMRRKMTKEIVNQDQIFFHPLTRN